jgi:hypothetical protein
MAGTILAMKIFGEKHGGLARGGKKTFTEPSHQNVTFCDKIWSLRPRTECYIENFNLGAMQRSLFLAIFTNFLRKNWINKIKHLRVSFSSARQSTSNN